LRLQTAGVGLVVPPVGGQVLLGSARRKLDNLENSARLSALVE
jgi:hypothetical protein